MNLKSQTFLIYRTGRSSILQLLSIEAIKHLFKKNKIEVIKLEFSIQ